MSQNRSKNNLEQQELQAHLDNIVACLLNRSWIPAYKKYRDIYIYSIILKFIIFQNVCRIFEIKFSVAKETISRLLLIYLF